MEDNNTMTTTPETGTTTGTTDPQTDEQAKPTAGQQFDEFLKSTGMQAEFDRRITKALTTQETRLTGDMDAKINEAVKEALRVSKMTAEQKAQHEAEQVREALAKREAEITKRELRATAKEALAEKGLPAGLADAINYTDSDSVNSSIEAIGTAFQAAVQAAVDARLKGGKAPAKADTAGNVALEQQIMNAMKSGFSF